MQRANGSDIEVELKEYWPASDATYVQGKL